MDLVKTLEDWNSNKALGILENMKDGEKAKVYIWTVEKEGKYFKVNQKHFEGVWHTLGYLDGQWAKVKDALLN